MHPDHLQAALARWWEILGAGHVFTEAADLRPYENNVSGLRRSIPAVLRPASTEEVCAVVQVANEWGTPLYPISRGKNWGLGSRLPVRDGCVVVDLSRMDRIREVNVAAHYAVIEPGVTQRQLYDYLCEHRLPLVLNVIGSGLDTSLIGNALDRGIGYFAPRADSMSGLEVVLGSGRLVRTGAAHYPGARTAHIHRHGLGPSLDGLFFQSNVGIVTAAGIDLMPRREASLSVVAKIRHPERMGAFIDALAWLRQQDIIQTVLHLANRHRTEIAMGPLVYEKLVESGAPPGPATRARAIRLLQLQGFGPWSAVAGLMGTRGQLREARRQIRRALRGIASVQFYTDGLLALAATVLAWAQWLPIGRDLRAVLNAVGPLYGLSKGVPTDAALKSVYWPADEDFSGDDLDPDQSASGLLFCVPLIPMTGAAAEETVALTEEVTRRHGFTPYITLNSAGTNALEVVINIAFRTDRPADVERAHTCNAELESAFQQRGLILCRAGIQSMERVIDAADPFWQTVREIKHTLDPRGIIAPGRFCPD